MKNAFELIFFFQKLLLDHLELDQLKALELAQPNLNERKFNIETENFNFPLFRNI